MYLALIAALTVINLQPGVGIITMFTIIPRIVWTVSSDMVFTRKDSYFSALIIQMAKFN